MNNPSKKKDFLESSLRSRASCRTWSFALSLAKPISILFVMCPVSIGPAPYSAVDFTPKLSASPITPLDAAYSIAKSRFKRQ